MDLLQKYTVDYDITEEVYHYIVKKYDQDLEDGIYEALHFLPLRPAGSTYSFSVNISDIKVFEFLAYCDKVGHYLITAISEIKDPDIWLDSILSNSAVYFDLILDGAHVYKQVVNK